jgi:hypothetical protein
MNVKVQRIGAQRRIKRVLEMTDSAAGSIRASSRRRSLRQSGSVHLSSNDLKNVTSHTSLASLDKKTQEDLQESAAVQDSIIKRGEAVEKAIKDALGDGAEVSVEVWNPWPWHGVLDKITEAYGLSANSESLNAFQMLFERIDTDRGGSIEHGEFYEALIAAGVEDITEEGVLTLFAMIDEDGSGEIDREEWEETIKFYLELKREDEMMHQDTDQAAFAREIREEKLLHAAKLTTLARKPKQDVNKKPAVAFMTTHHENSVSENDVGLDFDETPSNGPIVTFPLQEGFGIGATIEVSKTASWDEA